MAEIAEIVIQEYVGAFPDGDQLRLRFILDCNGAGGQYYNFCNELKKGEDGLLKNAQ